MRTVLWSIVICYLCSFAAGCAADRAFSAGESYEEEGRYEEAMFSYAEAYRCDPEDSEYRVRFLSARDKAARKRYKKGVERMKKGIYASALLEFQTAYGLDPSQGIYKQMVDEAAQKKNAQQAFQEGEEFEKADKLKDAYRFYSKAVETCPEQSEYRDARKKIAKILFAKP
nr:type II secretion system protein [Geobacteraceae bacterium]